MNVPTCYRCPERHPDPLNRRNRCPVLQAKLNAVKGAGLTSISFRCEKRETLFRPGDVVRFELCTGFGPENPIYETMIGIVMATVGRKIRLYCEGSDRRVIHLYPDGLRKTGKYHRTCIHCGRPEGKEFYFQAGEGTKPRPWECTTERWRWNENSGDYDPVPCEYKQDHPAVPFAAPEGEMREAWGLDG